MKSSQLKNFKICNGCGKSKKIWKNINGKKYCITCTNKIIPPKKITTTITISKRSEKRIIKDKQYAKIRKRFLLAHPVCMVKLPDCTYEATQIHHLYSGRDRDKYFLDDNTWKSTCGSCHTKIHNSFSSEELIKLGLKLID